MGLPPHPLRRGEGGGGWPAGCLRTRDCAPGRAIGARIARRPGRDSPRNDSTISLCSPLRHRALWRSGLPSRPPLFSASLAWPDTVHLCHALPVYLPVHLDQATDGARQAGSCGVWHGQGCSGRSEPLVPGKARGGGGSAALRRKAGGRWEDPHREEGVGAASSRRRATSAYRCCCQRQTRREVGAQSQGSRVAR
jgi:hypothetical protein